MSDEQPREWLLVNYQGHVERWVREYAPALPVILAVRAWLKSREEDPFAGVRLEPGLGPDYYFGVIPGTMGADGRIVTCAYRVFREDGMVRVDMISTASWPV